MSKISTRQQQIIEIIKKLARAAFSDIDTELAGAVTERTLKRELSDLVSRDILQTEGGGRSLRYHLNFTGRFFLPLDVALYAVKEPSDRVGILAAYQSELWQQWPKQLFSTESYSELDALTNKYRSIVPLQSVDIRARELERFVIELSWKSSRIEGNTYTLLDTERLIKEGIASSTNTEAETIMILNHKIAFDFVRTTPLENTVLTAAYVEKVHELLMTGLLADTGWRKGSVGITGSDYRPLDNQFQIKEAVDDFLQVINNADSMYDRALTVLLGISYIQPFVDGNKRTARLLANALLLSEGGAPLSYRNVDEVEYRSSLLAFYEQLSVLPMHDIFIEQYKFAVEHYT